MRYEVTLMVEVSNVEAPDEDAAAQVAISSIRHAEGGTIAVYPVAVEEAADVPGDEGGPMGMPGAVRPPDGTRRD